MRRCGGKQRGVLGIAVWVGCRRGGAIAGCRASVWCSRVVGPGARSFVLFRAQC